MDNPVLKKRLNTFKTAKGTLRKVSNDVVLEVLRAWENWPSSTAELYRELGLSRMQLVTMIQKGKRLVKSGEVVEPKFMELNIDSQTNNKFSGVGIELVWENNRVIRFATVDQLSDFLKKAA